MKKLFALIAMMFLSITAFAANTAALTWSAPTTFVDGTPVTGALTYGIYQGVKGQAKTKVDTVSGTSASFAAGLLSGVTYCWQVSTIANGMESALSIEACKTFPFQAPEPPTNLTVK